MPMHDFLYSLRGRVLQVGTEVGPTSFRQLWHIQFKQKHDETISVFHALQSVVYSSPDLDIYKDGTS